MGQYQYGYVTTADGVLALSPSFRLLSKRDKKRLRLERLAKLANLAIDGPLLSDEWDLGSAEDDMDTSDLSDIVVLSTSPSKEALKQEADQPDLLDMLGLRSPPKGKGKRGKHSADDSSSCGSFVKADISSCDDDDVVFVEEDVVEKKPTLSPPKSDTPEKSKRKKSKKKKSEETQEPLQEDKPILFEKLISGSKNVVDLRSPELSFSGRKSIDKKLKFIPEIDEEIFENKEDPVILKQDKETKEDSPKDKKKKRSKKCLIEVIPPEDLTQVPEKLSLDTKQMNENIKLKSKQNKKALVLEKEQKEGAFFGKKKKKKKKKKS